MKKLLATTAMVLALTAGAAYAEYGAPKGPPPHVKEALAKLSDDKADLVGDTLRQMHESGQEDRQKIKALHEELKTILTATTFSETAFLAKTKEIDAYMAAKHQKNHLAIAELASQLTQDERKVLADIMPGGKRFGHGKRHHGDHAGPGGMRMMEPPPPPTE